MYYILGGRWSVLSSNAAGYESCPAHVAAEELARQFSRVIVNWCLFAAIGCLLRCFGTPNDFWRCTHITAKLCPCNDIGGAYDHTGTTTNELPLALDGL
jgi:hypothetical protein